MSDSNHNLAQLPRLGVRLSYLLYFYRTQLAKETKHTSLGPDHPETLKSMNNIATLYSNQGKYELAEPLFVECLEKLKASLGPNHPETLRSMNNLATLYKSQGRNELAEALFVDCLEKQKTAAGPNHSSISIYLNTVHANLGKYESADIASEQHVEKKFLDQRMQYFQSLSEGWRSMPTRAYKLRVEKLLADELANCQKLFPSDATTKERLIELLKNQFLRDIEQSFLDNDGFAAVLSSFTNDLIPWKRSKIMLVGQGGAGKTALADNLMGMEFKPTLSTRGMEAFERRVVFGDLHKGHLAKYEPPERELENRLAEVVVEKWNAPKVEKPLETEELVKDQYSIINRAHFSNTVTSEQEQQVEFSIKKEDIDVVTYNNCISENLNRSGQGTIISLYDFGGQDIFNILHPFFMSKYGVYLIVFDMELFFRDFECFIKHIQFWINSVLVHTYSEEKKRAAPVALIGTKADQIKDLPQYKTISSEIWKLFSSSLQRCNLLQCSLDSTAKLYFFPVDNKDRTTGDLQFRLLQQIESVLEKEDYVTQLVPLYWIKFLDLLNNSKSNCVAFCEAESLAVQLGVISSLSQILTFLYEMGKLIWIDEDGLRDIIILDPIKYFVEPVTCIICKYIATNDDPYRIVHQNEVHKSCKERLNADWMHLLEFGILS